MTHFHAVMIDECGQEFGAGVEAATRYQALDKLAERSRHRTTRVAKRYGRP